MFPAKICMFNKIEFEIGKGLLISSDRISSKVKNAKTLK